MGNKTMLDKNALANSLAILMAIFYLIFYLLSMAAPAAFVFLFNAQFLGADVASLLPKVSLVNFIETLAALVIFCWVIGYAWAWLYNWLAGK